MKRKPCFEFKNLKKYLKFGFVWNLDIRIWDFKQSVLKRII